jgi:hypothetical protein
LIIVDTCIWIDQLRQPEERLAELLLELRALLHPYVLGELALGSLPPRQTYLRSMKRLPRPRVARQYEVLRMVEAEKLYATGIGYVDVHLLASARLTPGTMVWTRDGRLHSQAERLGLAFHP